LFSLIALSRTASVVQWSWFLTTVPEARVQFLALRDFLWSIATTIEELLRRNSSDSGLESRDYGRRELQPWPRDTLYPQKLALNSSTSGGRSIGIVSSRTKATSYYLLLTALGNQYWVLERSYNMDIGQQSTTSQHRQCKHVTHDEAQTGGIVAHTISLSAVPTSILHRTSRHILPTWHHTEP
jgi:hypothetical protein